MSLVSSVSWVFSFCSSHWVCLYGLEYSSCHSHWQCDGVLAGRAFSTLVFYKILILYLERKWSCVQLHLEATLESGSLSVGNILRSSVSTWEHFKLPEREVFWWTFFYSFFFNFLSEYCLFLAYSGVGLGDCLNPTLWSCRQDCLYISLALSWIFFLSNFF